MRVCVCVCVCVCLRVRFYLDVPPMGYVLVRVSVSLGGAAVCVTNGTCLASAWLKLFGTGSKAEAVMTCFEGFLLLFGQALSLACSASAIWICVREALICIF